MKKLFFTFLLLTQYLMGFLHFFDDYPDGNFTSSSQNLDSNLKSDKED